MNGPSAAQTLRRTPPLRCDRRRDHLRSVRDEDQQHGQPTTDSDAEHGDGAEELVLRSSVPGWAAGMQLPDYLAQRFRYRSRTDWLAEIAAGRILVDDVTPPAGRPLRAGQQVLYRKLHREPPVDRSVRVLLLDDHLLVVDKPAHLPCHGDGAFVRNTLVHLLRQRFGDVHLVHRLDRETSGALVAARSAAARASLERQFGSGAVQKSYLAIVRGNVPADFVADGPIARAQGSRIALRRAVAAGEGPSAKPAWTAFHVLRAGPRSLLRCVPKTGRTHQIRVHLEHAGFPVFGDKLYGRPDADFLAFVARVKQGGDPREVPDGEPDRQLLHAHQLEFEHPASGQRVAVEAPPPAAMMRWAPPAAIE